jgi:hypothetical protein
MSSDIRRIGALLVVSAVVGGLFVSPLWGRAHHFHHYRKAVIEKLSVEEKGTLRELGGNDVSPPQPGTRYVIAASRGTLKYSGEFYVEGKNDYPTTLRPGQKVSFRTSQQQIMACDIHNVMTLVTVNYLILRDPRGKDWDLFMSSNLPPDFNAEIRHGSTLDGGSQH